MSLFMSRFYQREEHREIYRHHSSRAVLKEVEDEAYNYLKLWGYRLFDDAEKEKEEGADEVQEQEEEEDKEEGRLDLGILGILGAQIRESKK